MAVAYKHTNCNSLSASSETHCRHSLDGEEEFLSFQVSWIKTRYLDWRIQTGHRPSTWRSSTAKALRSPPSLKLHLALMAKSFPNKNPLSTFSTRPSWVSHINGWHSLCPHTQSFSQARGSTLRPFLGHLQHLRKGLCLVLQANGPQIWLIFLLC